jgi:2-amino-4-hydroxy-6-hydroxymethyldihydropteridine diphosphokinase
MTSIKHRGRHGKTLRVPESVLGISHGRARAYETKLKSARTFIALGANLPSRAGSPAETIGAALVELVRPDVAIVRVSQLYSSPAWPDPAEPAYVNAVAEVRTRLSPIQLLELLHATETAFGRTRSRRNAPRTLDLDIIDYGSRVERGPPRLPHPRLSARAFVLVPLGGIAPAWTHPETGESVAALIAALPARDRESVVALDRA